MTQQIQADQETKRGSLSIAHTEFLREFAQGLNGKSSTSTKSYRGMGRENLLDVLSNKLTVDEVESTVKYYNICLPGEDVASKLNPASIADIRSALERYFQNEGIGEVKMGDRKCDLVFPDELIAVEIKSARDKISRAAKQTEDYLQWAEIVYLAYDSKGNRSLANHEMPEQVGLLEYEGGTITEVLQASKTQLPIEDSLSWMNYGYLEKICRSRNIDTGKSKSEMVEVLSSVLTHDEARLLYKIYMGTCR